MTVNKCKERKKDFQHLLWHWGIGLLFNCFPKKSWKVTLNRKADWEQLFTYYVHLKTLIRWSFLVKIHYFQLWLGCWLLPVKGFIFSEISRIFLGALLPDKQWKRFERIILQRPHTVKCFFLGSDTIHFFVKAYFHENNFDCF